MEPRVRVRSLTQPPRGCSLRVVEWTRDIFAPYPGAPDGVPAVEAWANDHHVTRGGRFTQDRDLARCARRHSLYDDQVGAGVRLVLDPGA